MAGPASGGAELYNRTATYIINKSLSDPKYAEYQRRETVADVKQTSKTLASLKDKVAKTKADQIANEKTIRTLSTRLVTLDADNNGVVDNPANATEFSTKNSQLKTASAKKATLQKSLTSYEKQVVGAENLFKAQSNLLVKLDDITGVTSNVLISNGAGGSSSDKGGAANATPLGEYKYNVPMMKSAYFHTGDLQTRLTKAGVNTPADFKNAQNDAFKQPGTRGAIQMNADTAKYLQEKFKSVKGKKIDPNAYGFRFHYNPTSVTMSYGQMQDVSPELLQGGEGTKFNPITPLGQGGFSFELYLNRIDDMSYAQSDGTLKLDGVTYDALDLYPQSVSSDTVKEIYRKGTMYDLEFIFRAVHGGSNDYTSALRGKTSDIGWLAGVAVEFHLGDNMRYLGRINGVSVNHVLFNERMVPMLTVVRVEASRFYDIPGVVQKSAPASSSASGGRSGGGPRGAVLD